MILPRPNASAASHRNESGPPLPSRTPSQLPDIPNESWDVSFAVPMVHRLRFTRDCWGNDAATLRAVFVSTTSAPVRVFACVDHCLAAAQPDLLTRLRTALQGNETAGHVPHSSLQLVCDPVLLPGGEAAKNDPRMIDELLAAIQRYDLDRHSYVLAIGGGAVLDAVGYAASIAHRGIRLVRIPTTTLAQGDSGVGVKTAINAFGKKNWIGTFAVPWAVINDARMLTTLPDRDWNCGFAEAVKVALLKDPDVFSALELHADQIRQRDMQFAWPALCQSVRLHLRHITEGGDPFEMQQARPLDFGHWSAHKLEPLSNYRLRHGEAVAIGVALDSYYSALVHGLPLEDAERISRCLERLGLPTSDPLLRDPRLLDGLEEFRQHLGGQLTVTMLECVGRPVDVHTVDREQMARAIELLCMRSA